MFFEVFSFQFSVFSFRFSVFGFRFSVFGFQILDFGLGVCFVSSFIPVTAPFDEQQRAWLNGFFAGLMGLDLHRVDGGMQAGLDAAIASGFTTAGGSSIAAAEDFPWHDSAITLDDRMAMVKEKPLERKLMAAMAQLDCGSCGYLCQTYAEAIASGTESNLTLCSPGGKETKQMIKLLLKDGAETGSINGHSTATPPVAATTGFNRKNPFSARLIESRTLNKPGSAKDVRHVVIDLAGSELNYEVGDALGIFPVNCHELASAVVLKLAADPSTKVRTPLGNTKPLIDAISEDCCLREPSDELLELLSGRVDDSLTRDSFAKLLADGTPAGFDVLDALELASRANVTATEVVESLSPLNPRLYSIASSMKKVGHQVHLTVGKVHYESGGRLRKGVASTMLADRIPVGETVRVFVQPNHGGFTVPANNDVPMIMVGPGTGIAPFVAFLQERESRVAKGKNWLFFGDQHQAKDFLYEDELNHYLRTGLLTRLDTAFSRDGNAKVYVQDRMREQATELWGWLSTGANFYVCGDASRMAADVDKALCEVIATHGKMNASVAKDFVKQLASSGRYVRDVY